MLLGLVVLAFRSYNRGTLIMAARPQVNHFDTEVLAHNDQAYASPHAVMPGPSDTLAAAQTE